MMVVRRAMLMALRARTITVWQGVVVVVVMPTGGSVVVLVVVQG